MEREFTMEAEQAALKFVCNPMDWKDEIHVILPIDLTIARLDEIEDLKIQNRDDLLRLLRDAILNATATMPEFDVVKIKDHLYLEVNAIGYRMGPCGDH